MVYESELIKPGKLKVGDVYRKQLLDFYAADYNCMLVIPNSPANIYFSDDMSNYKVKEIINNCSIITEQNRSMLHSYYESIVIIEKV